MTRKRRGEPVSAAGEDSFEPSRLHAGMPKLDASAEELSAFEFWPPQLFYTPIFLLWMALALRHGGIGLPTAANPGFPHGGFVGESKYEVLSRFGAQAREALAHFIRVRRDRLPGGAGLAAKRAMQAMSEAGLAFPVVAKPDLGCRGAGVQLVRSESGLADYLAAFPADADIVLQELVDRAGEAGLYYVRHPAEPCGRLFSMTLKYFPYVIGDGATTLRRLIERDPRARRLTHLYFPRHAGRLDEVVAEGAPVRLTFAGSHARGCIFRDGRPYITVALTERIDALARDIDGFYVGRFDVRFGDFEAFRRGEDLRIIEVNGAGGEATHIWDSRMTLLAAYRDLYRQYCHLFEIGKANAGEGARQTTVLEFLRALRREMALVRAYPMTH